MLHLPRPDPPGVRPPPCPGLPQELREKHALLARMPAHVWADLKAVPVQLKARQVLAHVGCPIPHAYFLEGAGVSLTLRTDGERTLEAGFLGHEDFVGWPLVLETLTSPFRCVVAAPGTAWLVHAVDLRAAVANHPLLRHRLLQYANGRLVTLAHALACRGTHPLQQRLASYLLEVRHCIRSDTIPLTHLQLSRALAVRRPGVTKAMGELEAMGLLHQERGRLHLLDADRLAGHSCNCCRHRPLNWSSRDAAERAEPRQVRISARAGDEEAG